MTHSVLAKALNHYAHKLARRMQAITDREELLRVERETLDAEMGALKSEAERQGVYLCQTSPVIGVPDDSYVRDVDDPDAIACNGRVR